ncbi:MAG: tetratricopeptide repeat protein [Flavobacteriales bacterium]
MKPCFILVILAMLSTNIYGQSASKLTKQAEKNLSELRFAEAIRDASEAIKLDPNKAEAYHIRAKASQQSGLSSDAVRDFEKVALLEPKNFQVFYEIAAIHLSEEKFKEAINAFEQLLAINPKHLDAWTKKAQAEIRSGDHTQAFESAKRAIAINKNDIWALYYAGEAALGLGNLDEAEKQLLSAAANVDASIKKNPNTAVLYGIVYQQLGLVQLKRSKWDLAENNLTKAINTDPQNPNFYFSRGQAMAAKSAYQNALNDYGQAIALRPKYAEAYLHRAQINEKLGQLQLAVNDYNQVLSIQSENQEALIGRASAFIAMKQHKDAIRDLKKVLKINPESKNANELLIKAKEEYYLQNIEKNAPEIVFKKPSAPNNSISLRADHQKLMVEFMVKDASPMKNVQINGKDLETDDEAINPTFVTEVNVRDASQIRIVTTDIYLNSAELIIAIDKIEVNPPIVKMMQPYSTDDNQMFIDDKPNLFIEGEIIDQSKIARILINGTSASFPNDVINPKFTATVFIGTNDTLSIAATDEHGNSSLTKYLLIREDSSSTNPMGRTWVVFIENSDYKNLQRLDTPEKDAQALRHAFSNYTINRFEVKRNMTKAQLDHYFSIELRDHMQKNRVNSLTIWYAGHGMYHNENGYWVPIDGDLNEASTLYSMNSLKSALKSYTHLRHIFVISNACDPGPAFYMAANDEIKGKQCDNQESTTLRSAQVFACSGKEQSNDHSLFTQAFVNVLNNAKDPCISAETIVLKVLHVFKQNQRQSPKYGKIKDLFDENGSFYFIKKN